MWLLLDTNRKSYTGINPLNFTFSDNENEIKRLGFLLLHPVNKLVHVGHVVLCNTNRKSYM